MALALTATADTITGRVVGIADGDTVTVLDAQHVQHKIRLAGIDAPDRRQSLQISPSKMVDDLSYSHSSA